MIADLRFLWEKFIDVNEAHVGENLKTNAMLFCTINDFPSYNNLYGYTIKGYKMCRICEVDTCSHQLNNEKKSVCLGHKKFQKSNRPHRRLWKAFNGEKKFDIAPNILTKEKIYKQQQHINFVLGKNQKGYVEKNIWKKRPLPLLIFNIGLASM